MLQIDNVSVSFDISKSRCVDALKNISFDLATQQTLGIVGESGSGKSTIARAITQLVSLQQGSIEWLGENTTNFDVSAMREFRKQVQLVFQDPLDALDPRMTVAEILAEPLYYLFTGLDRREINKRIEEVMAATGLSSDYLRRYPHEFSGGQCQRIGIARAMIVQPRLLICDEPVSALDVSIQAQIINLLADLKQADGLSMIFISHDMSVVKHISERVLVLYAGSIVELAEVDSLYDNPLHPYTKNLLEAVPLADPIQERQRLRNRSAHAGTTPKNLTPTTACAYYSRCSEADKQCRQQRPELREVAKGHMAACHKQ